jgi:hypothetical protein
LWASPEKGANLFQKKNLSKGSHRNLIEK